MALQVRSEFLYISLPSSARHIGPVSKFFEEREHHAVEFPFSI